MLFYHYNYSFAQNHESGLRQIWSGTKAERRSEPLLITGSSSMKHLMRSTALLIVDGKRLLDETLIIKSGTTRLLHHGLHGSKLGRGKLAYIWSFLNLAVVEADLGCYKKLKNKGHRAFKIQLKKEGISTK